MEENVKALIEKIQQEGIEAAQEKAREIEIQAEKAAEALLAKARLQAEKILSEAAQQAAETEESTRQELNQAARDMLLMLRKEISALLERIITAQVRQGLSPAELAKIITAIIKEQGSSGKDGITITLNKADLEQLQHAFIEETRQALKKGVVLKASEDIGAGFTLSFDSGKSHFDFTDKALAEYIGSCLKPKLVEILSGALTENGARPG